MTYCQHGRQSWELCSACLQRNREWDAHLEAGGLSNQIIFFPTSPVLFPFPVTHHYLDGWIESATYHDDTQRAFYDSWAAYDAAKARMPHETRDLQTRAEIVDLERQWRLS